MSQLKLWDLQPESLELAGHVICNHTNPKCTGESDICPAHLHGAPCWEVGRVPCCDKRDKWNCLFCTTYHAGLHTDR